jgi:predicted nucleic acid-binding protein
LTKLKRATAVALGIAPTDLLIAAAAEAAGIPVLHYDEDYDRIAAITGQDVQWLAPRGTLVRPERVSP